MDVIKVKLKVNQALFGRVYFAGDEFYITPTLYRKVSYVYNVNGDELGTIDGYWFDFGDKKVFERVE